MITVERLALRSGSFAVENLSFTVGTGQYAVLMGRTGSGKTSLLEAICGLRKVQAGRIWLDNVEVTHLRPADRGIGYVPQDLALFPTLNVLEHLAFALRVRNWPIDRIADRVAELSDLLGIGHLLGRYPLGLSGGEAQRVALGRALAFHPRILLLDEPLSALDEITREEMAQQLRALQQKTGVTTLHITHSPSEARRLGDRLFVFRHGAIHEESLLSPPREGIQLQGGSEISLEPEN